MTRIESFFGSKINAGLLLMRVIIGIIFFLHGIMKFNMGINMTAGFFEQSAIPAPLLFAWLVTLLETFGGLALILGVATRAVALLLIITMIVAILVLMHFSFPFISTQTATGYELNLALIASLIPILILGPGRYSLAKYIVNKNPAY
ncbi:MAG: DoxX family protein [Candidatus Nomurabacteria bacterium]|nr:DoxX family protein [Candidatus Nomurabacteria bacterium]